MFIDDIRRANLAYLAQQHGGVGLFSSAIGKDPSQVSQWINGSTNSGTGKPRGMRSSTCREIERKLDIDPGWLDKDHSPSQSVSKLDDHFPNETTNKQVGWPFEGVTPEQYEALPERIKGRIDQAAMTVIREWEQSKSAGAA